MQIKFAISIIKFLKVRFENSQSTLIIAISEMAITFYKNIRIIQ